MFESNDVPVLAPDRHEIVVHVEADVLADGRAGRCEIEHRTAIAAETARRLCCDAGIVPVVDGPNGEPLSVGRRTRSIPPAVRRALASRDRGCRFPGCPATHRLHGHHVRHWADGGETSLDNLILFIEDAGEDAMKRVTFYGHEKNETTAKLAQINLAVHGLEGRIRAGNEAITYYKDPHELAGKRDFVMANPPFNVDEVDAEKVKGDKRLPFGLPGVNKAKKVSNANYLWLSYFYGYLNENGRAGVVMSSQASSAGRDEAGVRRKLVESGEVEAHDWSLTPVRYVGVAPEEEDEDFDFEEALRSIHLDLEGLNEEAEKLAARIARNFEELGV